jgi:hypothetical protein
MYLNLRVHGSILTEGKNFMGEGIQKIMSCSISEGARAVTIVLFLTKLNWKCELIDHVLEPHRVYCSIFRESKKLYTGRGVEKIMRYSVGPLNISEKGSGLLHVTPPPRKPCVKFYVFCYQLFM